MRTWLHFAFVVACLPLVVGCAKPDGRLLQGDWMQVRYEVEGGDERARGEFSVPPETATRLQFGGGQITIQDAKGTRTFAYRLDGDRLYVADGPVESRWEVVQLNERALRLRSPAPGSDPSAELEMTFRRVSQLYQQ